MDPRSISQRCPRVLERTKEAPAGSPGPLWRFRSRKDYRSQLETLSPASITHVSVFASPSTVSFPET